MSCLYRSCFSVISLLTLATNVYGVSSDLNASSLPDSIVSTAWFAGWHASGFNISQIDWSKYTTMTYAFAVTTSDDTLISLEPADQALLPKFVSAAHKHNVKASLSIGGWTGSRYFSSHFATAANRTAFVQAVVNLVQKYQLDSIDFDWEYPGVQGIGCNVVSPNDTPNFLSFLQELRASPTGSNITLSAATYTTPFADATGQPSKDVSGFSKVLDYIAIMNYDTRSNPSFGAGPNAPIDDSCAPPEAQRGSATSAVKAWVDAGMPAHQIVLGVPAYGHSFSVATSDALRDGPDVLAAFPSYNPSASIVGDRWDGGGVDVCGVLQGPAGVYTYWGLVEEGFLNPDGSPAGGIVYRYDNCSETPWAYNPGTQILISYDNQQSFSAKGDFIKTQGLRGLAMWEAGGDLNNTLLTSILDGTINGDPSRPKQLAPPGKVPSASTSASASPRLLPRSLALELLSFGLGVLGPLVGMGYFAVL